MNPLLMHAFSDELEKIGTMNARAKSFLKSVRPHESMSWRSMARAHGGAGVKPNVKPAAQALDRASWHSVRSRNMGASKKITDRYKSMEDRRLQGLLNT